MKKQMTLGAIVTMLSLVVSATAFAQAATEIAPVNDLADSVLGVLTGRLARTAGAIALAVVGYRWYTGQTSRGRALVVICGIVLVLGAPTIIEWLDSFV